MQLRNSCHIECTYRVSLLCVTVSGFLNLPFHERFCHIQNICVAFHLYVFFHVSLVGQHLGTVYHIVSRSKASLLYVSFHELLIHLIE